MGLKGVAISLLWGLCKYHTATWSLWVRCTVVSFSLYNHSVLVARSLRREARRVQGNWQNAGTLVRACMSLIIVKRSLRTN